MKKLPRSFYTRSTLVIAKDLLGKIFVRHCSGTILSGIIVETEAYLFNDPASHAFNGITDRNKVMFNQGGYLYVYFTYGMHFCANVVTSKTGVGEAVLIRAVEPISGIRTMIENRKIGEIKNLANGPAKFAQAFQLSKSHSGIDLTADTIYINDAPPVPLSKIIKTERIGISRGKEKKWRFYIKDNQWISKK